MSLITPSTTPNFMGGAYPDANSSKGITREDLNIMQEFFGPVKTPIDPSFDRRTVAELLSMGFNGSIGPAKRFIHAQLTEANGWWTVFAPPRRMDEMSVIQIDSWFRENLELAPEDTGPKFITHKTEAHTEQLLRYKIGARFRVDFFKTNAGQEVYMNTLYTIANATYAKMKELTILAITNSKQVWRDQNDQTNTVSTQSPLDTTARERLEFGLLSKDDHGIYKLWASVQAIFQTENLLPTMMVVPRGILTLIAFNSFEAGNASTRGEDTLNRRLTMGGQSIFNIFKGLTIYEDSIWSNTRQERDMLFKRTTIGQWFFVDGSEIKQICNPCETEEDILSIKVPSMGTNSMEKISIKQAIDNSMRYDDNGNLHPHFDYIEQNLPQILEALGFEIQDDYIDPYMFAVTGDDGRKQFKKIITYGDMDPRALSHRQTADFGKRAYQQMDKEKVLTDLGKEALRQIMSLRETLSKPSDILNDSFQGYFFAIEANPENKVNLARRPSYFLNSNSFGSVQPPYVERSSGNNAAAGTDANSRMYVLDPSLPGERLYVHAIKSAGTGNIKAGVTTGFVLAPLQYYTDGANTAELRRAEFIGNNPDVLGDDDLVPVLVNAPSRPYGFGDITGLRTLAQLYDDVDSRGWDRALLKQAHDGIESIDAYFSWLEKLFPLNDFFNANFLPLHMVSGRLEEDTRNSAVSSLLGDQKYPVLVRISRTGENGLTMINLGGLGPVPTAGEDKVGFSTEKVDDILRNMGFDFGDLTETAATLAALERASEKQGRIYLSEGSHTAEQATLIQILRQDQLSGAIKNELLENGGVDLFQSYESLENNLGKSYGQYLTQNVLKRSGDFRRFAWLWDQNISGSTDIASSAKLLDNILSAAQSPENVASISQGYIDRIISSNGNAGNSKKRSRDSDNKRALEQSRADRAAEGQLVADDNLYINSRLVLDRSVFQGLSQKIKNNDANLIAAFLSIIRPSDPEDSTKPLAGYSSLNVFNDPLAQKSLRNALQEYEYAAVKYRSQGTGTLGHPGLLKGRKDEFNEYDDMTVPNTFYRKKGGPFTTQITLSDDTQSSCPPDEAATAIVSRPWVLRRLQEINRTIKDPFVKIPAQLFVLSRVSKDTVFNWIDNNLPQPHRCIIYAQPWIRFIMAAAIVGIPGPNTAEIGYNHEDTILQLDGVIKDWTLHFTIYLGAFIYDPRNFMVLHDVAFAGYVGGYDTRMYHDLNKFEPSDLTHEDSVFVLDNGAMLKRTDIPDPLSTRFKYDDRQTAYRLDSRITQSQIPQIPAAIYYASLWGLNEINSNTDVNRFSFNTEKEGSYANEWMFSGSQLSWSGPKEGHKELFIGTGHIGTYIFSILILTHSLSFYSSTVQCNLCRRRGGFQQGCENNCSDNMSHVYHTFQNKLFYFFTLLQVTNSSIVLCLFLVVTVTKSFRVNCVIESSGAIEP